MSLRIIRYNGADLGDDEVLENSENNSSNAKSRARQVTGLIRRYIFARALYKRVSKNTVLGNTRQAGSVCCMLLCCHGALAVVARPDDVTCTAQGTAHAQPSNRTTTSPRAPEKDWAQSRF